MTDGTLSPDTRYVRANDVVGTGMDGEIVMMDVKKGSYFAINGSGPEIWERLAEPILLRDLIASLAEGFETGAQDEFEQHVTGFVRSLVTQGLVKPAD